MNKSRIVAAIATVWSVLPVVSAQAGREVGNGGNAVVCYSRSQPNQIESVELFDFWEMRQALNGPVVDLGAPNLSVERKLEIFLERVAKFDPYRAEQFRASAHRILSQLSTVLSDELEPNPINDDTSTYVPAPPCVKRQFAVQIRNPEPGQSRFQIDRELWNLSDNDQKLGIVMHEVIYREAIKTGQTNSDRSRRFNYAVARSPAGFSTLTDYRSELTLAGFGFDRVIPIQLKNLGDAVIFVERNGQVNDVPTLALPAVIEHRVGDVRIRLELRPEEGEHRIGFRLNDREDEIESISSNDSLGQLTAFGQSVPFTQASFHASGAVERAWVIGSIHARAFGNTVECGGPAPEGGEIGFSAKGTLSKCDLASGARFRYLGMEFQLRGQVPGDYSALDIGTNAQGVEYVSYAPLAAKVLMKVEGSNHRFEFKDAIGFSPIEPNAVSFGYFVTPITRTVHGAPVSIRVFKSQNNRPFVYLERKIAFPRIDGNRVMAISRNEDELSDVSMKTCILLGYEYHSSDDLKIALDQSISGTERFYEPLQGRALYVTDDSVDVVSSIECGGFFSYAL